MRITSDFITESAKFNLSKNLNYIVKEKECRYGIIKTLVKVLNEEGSEFLNKDKGDYITLDCKNLYLFNDHLKMQVAKELADSLKELFKYEKIGKIKSALVVGLGNKELTADSLGPKVVDKIVITRHLRNEEGLNLSFSSVSAIATGVLGTTGIETATIIKAVKEEVAPDVIIVVDTLATVKTSRIAASFQLTNAGITPGGGVNNNRLPISKKTMGVPVVVIGMPLVVFAYSMCIEVLEAVNDEGKDLNSYDEKLKKTASSLLGSLVVTIKDIDKVIENSAFIIALAINMVVNEHMKPEEIIDYMN
jgi:spore protease